MRAPYFWEGFWLGTGLVKRSILSHDSGVSTPQMNESAGTVRFYANLIPESLVASNLDPLCYGAYLATGESGRSRGQAIFFEVREEAIPDSFAVEEARRRCRPDASGNPKHSVYLGIYRVLERLPLSALGRLFLTTDDGRVLALEAAPLPEEASGESLHYYQEFVPVKPRILSRLGPVEFARHLCREGHPVSVPCLAFAELHLPGPGGEDVGDLPYSEMEHLKDCMGRMLEDPEKKTKMITRFFPGEVIYRTVRSGFYVAATEGILFYPMPERIELERCHHDWWKSAETLHMS